MNLSEKLNIIDEGYSEETIQAIYAIMHQFGDDEVDLMITRMMNDNTSYRLKLTIAGILGFIGAEKAVPYLIELARRPENVDTRGEYIYGLMHLNCIDYFSFFVEILCTANFECSYKSQIILKKYALRVNTKIRKDSIKTIESYVKLVDSERCTNKRTKDNYRFMKSILSQLKNVSRRKIRDRRKFYLH